MSSIFLSNPPVLTAAARRLARALSKGGLRAVGAVALQPGDPWDEVHHAQARSPVTAALIATDAVGDWYQSEDIVRGIALARAARHQVVPICLGDAMPTAVPYGLQRLTPIFWAPDAPAGSIVDALRTVAERMAAAPAPRPASPARTVFMLYAAPDADWAMWMADQLAAAGFAPRLAEADLTAGQNRWLYANEQLQADRVLLLVSRNTPDDRRLTALWTAAFDGDPTGTGAQLVPVLLDDTPPPRLVGPRIPIDLRAHRRDAEAMAAALVAGLRPSARRPAVFPSG